jgi:hypothetical protein
MTHLLLRLVLACAVSDGVVDGIEISRFTISVTRGSRHLDPRAFRLSDHAPDHFGLLTP